jgi:RimJ/RimL family protein N-acetyltransferase|tara:strand:- start:1810 stop:2412 length:603 start_codon:yes stop_codon:yes gene_type:complete
MNGDKWLAELELKGDVVTLLPLKMEHASELVKAASDGDLWNIWYTSVPSAVLVYSYIDFALTEKAAGRSLPFVVIDNVTQQVIGATRFCNADIIQKRVEIGYTWYSKSFQRTSVNAECKFLLLKHAFEKLSAIAVEFRTHWHNHTSRGAIARLGAKQDGILRNHRKMANGSFQDTVVFSIINHEWPAVKQGLMSRLNICS